MLVCIHLKALPYEKVIWHPKAKDNLVSHVEVRLSMAWALNQLSQCDLYGTNIMLTSFRTSANKIKYSIDML